MATTATLTFPGSPLPTAVDNERCSQCRFLALRSVLRSLLSVMSVVEKVRSDDGSCLFALCFKPSSKSWFFLVYSGTKDICEAHIILDERVTGDEKESALTIDHWNNLEDQSYRETLQAAFSGITERWLEVNKSVVIQRVQRCAATCRLKEEAA